MVVALCASVLAGTVTGQAQSLPGADWSPAAGAVGDNTYQGFIDRPSAGASMPAGAAFQVSGWVFDNTAQGWSGIDDVQVMLGGTSLGHLSVGQSRPDVAGFLNNPNAATSGFSGTISSSLPTGQSDADDRCAHARQGLVVEERARDRHWRGWRHDHERAPRPHPPAWCCGSSRPAVATWSRPTTTARIYGVAYDTRTRPELGSGVDRVSAYLDGPRGTAGSQSLGDATFNGTNWSITWQPTHYNKERHHILWVYARSAVTGEETLLQQDINLSS